MSPAACLVIRAQSAGGTGLLSLAEGSQGFCTEVTLM